MGECVLCKEQITNPLSPQRLTEEMTTWLGETRPDLIKEFTEETNSFLDKEVRCKDSCIINGKRMNICAYCFTKHAFHWLDEKNITPESMKEYITFFNYDITGQGYVKEYRNKYVEE